MAGRPEPLSFLERAAAERADAERRLAAVEEVLGSSHPHTAKSLDGLALMIQERGEYDAARLLFERALEIRERVLGPEHADTALSLNNLGLLLYDQGDYDAARPVFERALAIRERAYGPEHPETAANLGNLAIVLEGLGELETARQLCERALSIREEALGPWHPDTAMSLNNLGSLLQGQGQHAAARPLLERAIEICERVHGRDHPWTATSRTNLAGLLIDLGDPEAAWGTVRREGERRGDHRRRILGSMTEGERFRYLARVFQPLELELSLAAGLGDPAAALAAYEDLLEWKGQLARMSLASREGLSAASTPEQRELVAGLRACQARLSALALETDVRDPQVHEQRVAELRGQRNRLELELQRSMGSLTEVRSTSFDEMQAALPERSVVLDFFLHRVRRPSRVEGGQLRATGGWSERRLSVWITRPEVEVPVHLDLGEAAPIERAVRAFLEDMVARRGLVLGEVPGGEDRGAALRSILWDPLAPRLEGADALFVSPDGFLGTLPWEALPLEDGRFAIERCAFVYLQDLASLPDTERSGRAALDSLLAAGGVDFRSRAAWSRAEEESPAPASSLRGGFADYWPRLPATAPESQVVFDLHEDVFGEGGQRLLLQGVEVTEERLKHELPRYASLHLATHGFFQPEGLPSIWKAALEEAQEVSLRREARHLVGKHPGLLSGLVCAGANRPEEGREDGYLTAEEVGWLDLSGVELVVLSACETGLGRAESGEGLIGLRRAFRSAGARTVISSLWSVQDESTGDLMRELHRNLLERGMGRLEALRSAQLWMLRRNRLEHGRPLPSTWGAFVLSGEWR